jgi:uncharacterized protein YfbU (UPF0304 family)
MLGNIGANGIAEATYRLEMALFNDEISYIKEELVEYIINLVELSDHLEILLKKMDVKNIAKNEEQNQSFLNYDFTKTKESIKLSSDLLERKII